MKLVWTAEALFDFEQNIAFLEHRYNEKVVFDFIRKTKNTLETILSNPEAFQLSHYKNTRYVPITKHINLFYLISQQQIYLLRFWNNFQNPGKLKL